MLGRLVMMPSSLQVLDHHLFISKIISGVGQFHHWPKRGEERRGEESWAKIVKMLPNQKRATTGKHRSSRRGEEKSSRSNRTRPNKSAAAYQKQQLWSHY